VALVAAAVLGTVAVLAARLVRDARRRAAARLHPHEPWRHDWPWDRSGAQDLSRREARRSVAAAAAVALALLPAHLVAAWNPGGFPRAVLVALDLVVPALLLHAAWLARRGRGAAGMRLRYHAFPSFLGDPLELTLEMGRVGSEARAVEVTLACQEWRGVEEWKDGERATTWQDVELCRATAAVAPAAEIPLRFALPAGPAGLGTDLGAANPRRWELQVLAEGPGGRRRATFPVPVYARPDPQAERRR
jgi:hypothetical protein